MHPIQDLFLKSFSYVLQFDMQFYMHTYLDKKIILVKSGCYSILPEEGCIILHDIQSGICSSHESACTLVGKMYRQQFYWPTTVSNADSLVRHYEECQFFAR
jgi:hypothetical protein